MNNRRKINAAVIGAGSESINAIKKAQEMGIEVIALDGNPNAEGMHYADKSFTVNIRDHDLIFDILDQFPPDAVIPIPIGRYLTSVGAVNDRYNLMGVTQKAAKHCTDKHLFHTMLSKRNLRHAEHILIPSGNTDLSIETAALNFPIITKPRYGSGSRGVRTYRDENDLKNNFLTNLPFDEDFILESYINGAEYGVDAAIINGELHLILLREKIVTPYPYCQSVGYLSIQRDVDNIRFFEFTEDFLRKTIQILGINNCLINADIIRDENDDIFIIEIAARPSGHNLHNIFTPMVTGVDMVSEYLKFTLPQLNKSYSFSPLNTECMLIKYFDLPEGRVVKIPNKDFLCDRYPIKEFKCNVNVGTKLRRATDGHSLMTRGYYIISGQSKDELIATSNEIANTFIIKNSI